MYTKNGALVKKYIRINLSVCLSLSLSMYLSIYILEGEKTRD